MSGWMDGCLLSIFFKLLLLQFLSDSYESWHTWVVCQWKIKLWKRFVKFCFLNFLVNFKILRRQRSSVDWYRYPLVNVIVCLIIFSAILINSLSAAGCSSWMDEGSVVWHLFTLCVTVLMHFCLMFYLYNITKLSCSVQLLITMTWVPWYFSVGSSFGFSLVLLTNIQRLMSRAGSEGLPVSS